MNSALRQPISDRDNLSAAAPGRLMSNDRGSIRVRLAKISAQVSAFFQVKSKVEALRDRHSDNVAQVRCQTRVHASCGGSFVGR